MADVGEVLERGVGVAAEGSSQLGGAMPWNSKTLTARAEGGTHDGEEFEITEETVGLLLNSRRDPAVLEYYEFVLYMRGNLLMFVREYDADERQLTFGGKS